MDAKTTSRIDRLLRPRSIAIVGVSPEPGHPGSTVLANLERCRFEGEIHLVSRSRTEFNGRAVRAEHRRTAVSASMSRCWSFRRPW